MKFKGDLQASFMVGLFSLYVLVDLLIYLNVPATCLCSSIEFLKFVISNI